MTSVGHSLRSVAQAAKTYVRHQARRARQGCRWLSRHGRLVKAGNIILLDLNDEGDVVGPLLLLRELEFMCWECLDLTDGHFGGHFISSFDRTQRFP